jgi:hypothetical protein
MMKSFQFFCAGILPVTVPYRSSRKKLERIILCDKTTKKLVGERSKPGGRNARAAKGMREQKQNAP